MSNSATTATAPSTPADQREDTTYVAAAVYVANSLADEAAKTEDPAKTLDDILGALPEAMPQVFQKMGTAEHLAETLLPDVAHRVRAFRNLSRARATADAGYSEVFDIMRDAVRDGGDPAEVSQAVLELLEQARDERKTLVAAIGERA